MLASPIKGIQAKCVYQTKGIYLYMHAQKKKKKTIYMQNN